MSQVITMLSGFAIAFLPRSKHLLILWLQSPSAVILESKKVKSVTASTFPSSISHEVMGLDAMILAFWMLSFKPAFSPSLRGSLVPLHFLPWEWYQLAYLRLLLFLPAILIPVCNSSSQAFFLMYSAYKSNKQGDDIQPCRTPFPVLNQSVFPCLDLPVATWPAYRFLRR